VPDDEKRLLSVRQRARLVSIADYYLRGHSIPSISAKVGVTVGTVRRYLQLVQEEWRERYTGEIEMLKTRELAKIDALETVYYDAWLNSKETKIIKKRDAENQADSYKEGTITQTPGDTKYLDGVKWCIEKRCQILGIGSKNIRISDGENPGRETIDLSDSEVAIRLLSVITSIKPAQDKKAITQQSDISEDVSK